MYKIDMKKIREEKDILQCAKDMKEAANAKFKQALSGKHSK